MTATTTTSGDQLSIRTHIACRKCELHDMNQESYFLQYIALQVRAGSQSHGSPGNLTRAIYQEVSFRQDATIFPGDPRIAAKQHKCLKKIVKTTSTRLLNNIIMSFKHFYDSTRLTVYRRLYCLRCCSSFGHIIDSYRPLTCNERMETIDRIACIKFLLD